MSVGLGGCTALGWALAAIARGASASNAPGCLQRGAPGLPDIAGRQCPGPAVPAVQGLGFCPPPPPPPARLLRLFALPSDHAACPLHTSPRCHPVCRLETSRSSSLQCQPTLGPQSPLKACRACWWWQNRRLRAAPSTTHTCQRSTLGSPSSPAARGCRAAPSMSRWVGCEWGGSSCNLTWMLLLRVAE